MHIIYIDKTLLKKAKIIKFYFFQIKKIFKKILNFFFLFDEKKIDID